MKTDIERKLLALALKGYSIEFGTTMTLSSGSTAIPVWFECDRYEVLSHADWDLYDHTITRRTNRELAIDECISKLEEYLKLSKLAEFPQVGKD